MDWRENVVNKPLYGRGWPTHAVPWWIETTLLQQANAAVIDLSQAHEAKLSRWHAFKYQF